MENQNGSKGREESKKEFFMSPNKGVSCLHTVCSITDHYFKLVPLRYIHKFKNMSKILMLLQRTLCVMQF